MRDDKTRLLADTIARLHRRGAHRPLQRVIEKTYPTDLAEVMRIIPEGEVTAVYSEAPPELAAEVLVELTPRVRDVVLTEMTVERLKPILEELAPDDLTDLIDHIDPDLGKKLMEGLAKESKAEVEELMQYAPETAGGIMTPDVFALPDTMSVQEAIDRIHAHEDVEMVFYLYVTDEAGRLLGVISLRQLLIAQPAQSLREIMKSRVIKVQTNANQEEVANLAERYRILAVPVVDENNVLVGMVTVDDIIDVIQSETTQDMLKLAGTDAAETVTHSVFKIARIRLPWLAAAFVGGLAATGVIDQFQPLLGKLLALSAFLPVVMGMAGNVGVQASTVAVRGLATGTLNTQHVYTVVFKELQVGLLLGAFYGISLGAFGWLVFGNVQLGSIVGLTILVNMAGAAVLAIVLPIFFHRTGYDPAIATGPFVTTAVDILGVLNYFVIATLLLL